MTQSIGDQLAINLSKLCNLYYLDKIKVLKYKLIAFLLVLYGCACFIDV